MTIKTREELQTLRESGGRLAKILDKISASVKPGLESLELDRMAEALILSLGGDPVFKGYKTRYDARPFPASICVSINDEVVHGIPSKGRVLRDGDVVGLDIGMRWPSKNIRRRRIRFWRKKLTAGLITDMAVTVAVGSVSSQASGLIKATNKALERGISAIRPGARLGDIGCEIQRIIESSGFSVVRDLAGHGVGRRLHEEPYVPNYGVPGGGAALKEGMVLAIEPMAVLGGPDIILGADDWTWHTKDGSLAAHFEHTIVVTKTGAEILTAS